uniref:uncharacterized protein LOC105941465 isoform X2 n=1 Tax=Maylandia zebra TaxID=106582 RepID=UPI000646E1E9|nr:uncharacterized protein LOC105941465 isoform X2 [Maylandia zebra]
MHVNACGMEKTYFFFVCFTAGILCCFGGNEGKTAVKAKERADVTLQTGESPSNAKIIWTFGAENPNMRLATIKKRVVKSDYDARFKDRLQLDSQTGALTITQLSVQDSGIYKWQAISDTILWKQFNLTVYFALWYKHPVLWEGARRPAVTVNYLLQQRLESAQVLLVLPPLQSDRLSLTKAVPQSQWSAQCTTAKTWSCPGTDRRED